MILFLGVATAKAGNGGSGGGSQVQAVAVLDGSQHQIQPDSTITVVDSSFFDPTLSGLLVNKSYTVQNSVTVMINESSTRYMHTHWTATLKLFISSTDSAGAVDTMTRSFTVGYDSTGTYSSRNTYTFQGGHRVTVKVVSDSTDATGWDPMEVLLIENQLTTRPAFVFNCQTTIGTITVSPSTDTTADELPVSWNAVLGADQYDLEWTYIYDSALADERYGAAPNYKPDLIFRNNSTRVTVTGTSYNSPLIYDDYGTLFVRVRPVKQGAAGAVINAIWSSDASPSVMGVYAFNGHERPLNWQSNISYAEEGKRKVVVQYYDGSLRSRQTVTKDNTTNTTIVGETYYDYQGRPSIQVMPAPTLSNVIKYTAGFNVSINSPEYSQANYDTLTTIAYCDAHADAMNDTSGASQYYSPDNPQANQGLNQFIPDAGNYPFTETEYTPDNTGRISRQGGVGPDHQLGSGHETKYYYGTPDQSELDGLFGTEVGDKSHYFKNMVRDANGQYSVSYVDMHGRTIATALSGSQPAGMSPLASNNVKTITETLADPSTASVRGLSMISQKSLVVSQGDTYNFSYSLLPDSLQQANCQSQDICYTCRYDLTITITDNCNNEAFGGQPYVVSHHNFSLASLANSCQDTAMDYTFSVPLPEGSYVITKQLTIDQDAYNYYRDSMYLPNNTCTSLSQLLTEQKSVIASKMTACTASCSDCLANVGSFSAFLASYNQALGLSATDTTYQTEARAAYQSALSACAAVCQTSTDVDDIRNAMLQDMTPPFGQYADSSKAPANDEYSIFYAPASDTGYVPVFKLPEIVYHDDNGKPDSVYDAESGLMVTPNSLTKEAFVADFRPSWANDLLRYHPDYCRLTVMETDTASYRWDRGMQSLDTYDAAKAAGYLNPLNQSQPSGIGLTGGSDPIAGTGAKNDLQSATLSYQNIQKPNRTMTMWGLAVAMVKCANTTDDGCVLHYAEGGGITPNYPYGFDDPTLCPGDKDMAWRNFRQMYLQKKQDLVYKDLLASPSGCTVANSRVYKSVPKISTLLQANHTSSFTQLSDQLNEQDGPLKYLSNINGPTDAANAVSKVQDSLNAFNTLNVNAYAQQWYQQLTSSCKLYDANDVKATLIPALKALCQEATDVDHPYGASTLPSGATPVSFLGAQCTSFTQIVNQYDMSKGIDDPVHCNAEVINSPLPYDNQPVYSVKPEFGRPSDCECSIITGLFNQYSVSHFGDTSFSAYLLRTQHVTMSGSDLNTLLGMCDNTTNTLSCNNNENPIYLPPVMQCHAGQTCSSCQTIDSLYTAFQVAYPGILPTDSSDADTAQSIKNQLFQNYMNNRLGYSLQFWEYLQFMDTCKAHAADTATSTNCTPVTVAQEFKTGGTDQMNDIKSTSDGGFIMAGSTTAGSAGGTDAYAIRYNSAGSVQWARTWGGTGDDLFSQIQPTTDGGFIAIGTTHSGKDPNGDMFIVKMDAAGTRQWEKQIGFGTNSGELGQYIAQLPDHCYAAGGIYNFEPNSADFMVARLDSMGTVNWVRRFGTKSSDNTRGLATSGDTILVSGVSWNKDGAYLGAFYKLDANTGAVFNGWDYQNSEATDSSAYLEAITPTATGYLINSQSVFEAGQGGWNLAETKLSPSGAVLAYNQLDYPNSSGNTSAASTCLIPTSDGGLLFGETGNFSPNIYWSKVSSSGTMQWSRQTTLPGTQTLGGIVQNTDSSFTALGTENRQATMLNLSSTGTTGCYDSTVTLHLTPLPLVKVSWPDSLGIDTLQYPVQTDTILAENELTPSDSLLVCSGTTNCYVAYNGPLLCGKAAPMLTPNITSVTNCSDSTFFTVSTSSSLFRNYSDSLTGDFEQRYLAKCMNAYRHETFTVTHQVAEYHYTLYYYDQAGNLLKTVPPAGVQQITDTTWLKEVAAARAAGASLTPHHTLVTNYRYNTLNQVIAQRTPDGGGSQFWYDRLGRLAVSQNARQNPNNQYSFTEYDTIGRITQVGQLVSSTAISNDISRSQSSLATWLTNSISSADQITATTYDVANDLISDELAQRNTRNRVSYTNLYNTAADLANGTPNAAASTYYSYDILGNVDTLVQDYGNSSMYPDVSNAMNSARNRFKKIVYDFDLVSGKVNRVSYQHKYADAFYHDYQYDAENRITNVQTSTDSVNWDNDAFYSYYKHGPLARTVLGEQQVQGINYAYTIQGWLKAINPDPYTGAGFTLRPDSAGNVVANNAYSLLLDYYNGDYKPISNVAGPDDGVSVALGADSLPLFNGNISSMGVNIKKLNSPLLYSYQYDQLNRLTHMDAWKRTSTAWSALTASTDYQENVTYDPNGNILTYHRNRENTGSSNQMDQLQYNYISGTNQLDHIYDTVSGVSNANDIATQSAGNYKYDSIGELVSDAASNITSITWTVYGKIASITKSTDTVIKYTYDPSGNRISKTVVHGSDSTVTWYVRDAQGNILSIYTYGDPAVNGGALAQTELDIYGSSRLGIWKRDVPVTNLDSTVHNPFPNSGDSITFTRGNKLFELTNHLGNVLATISDKRYGVTTDDSTVVYYNPEVVSANDYYPFGMMQYARSYSEANVGNYRFGFNGKENDNEVKGVGSQIDYGMRVYDPRLAKFTSVDPLHGRYPELTPYQFASNSPIAGIDLDGKEFSFYGLLTDESGKNIIGLYKAAEVDHQFKIKANIRDDLGQKRAITKDINASTIGLREKFVSNGKEFYHLPQGFDIDDLPSPGDKAWEMFETYDEYVNRIVNEGNKLLGQANSIVQAVDWAHALGGIYVNKLIKVPKWIRQRAVEKAWKQEIELVQKTGYGSQEWTNEDLELLKEGKKVPGYEGHHINSVENHPDQAADPNNIKFYKGRTSSQNDHLYDAHNGDYRNQTEGPLIDRKQLLQERLQQSGQQTSSPPSQNQQ
ncbi:MAG TPA: RHS repeat-associated core domain-containing protein [Puia sp.]|nr:RHS repeat-associated core domain-containing protein [Puia sp.]